jgi:hypothetical protein
MHFEPVVLGIIGGVITLAIVAVVLSQRAQTPAVLTGAGNALAQVIGAAVSPLGSSGANTFGSVGSNIQGMYA